MRLTDLTADWHFPTRIFAGVGRIKVLPDVCRDNGIKHPLLITDPGLVELPIVKSLLALCQASGMDCSVFSGVKSNPNGQNVQEGVQVYQAANCDGVIALGGGSALDAAKTVALMVGQNRPLWDFEDIGDNWLRVNPADIAAVVAVPTTAGTGSEVGRASVIHDSDECIKKIIFHPDMLPKAVILDPELTVSLPAKITAATGMDALSHNLEAYCAPGHHPMAAGIAIEGIRLVKDYLPTATARGEDLHARAQMLIASSMGATAFQRGLGGMHALAHPLGALYDAHHGLLNAILMPYVLQANQPVIENRIARLSRYLNLGDSFESFFEWVLTLRKQLEIPNTLTDIGIDGEKASQVAEMAVKDPSAGGNPIQFNTNEYKVIFEAAVHGKLR